MITPGDIRVAIRDGLNVHRLCRETGINQETLIGKLNTDNFTFCELTLISRTIKQWNRENKKEDSGDMPEINIY